MPILEIKWNKKISNINKDIKGKGKRKRWNEQKTT